MMNRRRRGRGAFTPSMDGGGAVRLEVRQLAAAVAIHYGWITLPQSDIRLTDNKGGVYTVKDGKTLLQALRAIDAAGRKIGELTIKGHGWVDIIYLQDGKAGEEDTLAILQKRIQIHGEDITALFQRVTGPDSRVNFTGCVTGKMAKEFSTVCQGTYLGSPAGAWGIPYTSYTLGWYQSYRDGNLVPGEKQAEPTGGPR